MQTPDFSDARSRHRAIAMLTALVVVLVLTGIGVYGLIAGPPTSNEPGTDDRDQPGPAVTAHPVPTTTPRLPMVRPSADPETFARTVATVLFSWDTGSGFLPLDYTSVVLTVGDPSGAEQAGLAADIASYLPNREAWVELRQYATTQHLEITDAFVPGAWATAQEQAQPGQLVEGTTAITIEGVRHRAGVWNDEPVDSAHEVAFTVFVVCEPAYDTCHLLRLSELDNPLR